MLRQYFQSSKRTEVEHARHTEVIASRSELLSLHCLRCHCFCVLSFLPGPIRGSLSARMSQLPPRHPCAGLRLARGSSSVQSARLVWVYGHFPRAMLPTQEWQFKNLSLQVVNTLCRQLQIQFAKAISQFCVHYC